MPLFASLRSELAGIIRSASSLAAVKKRLGKFVDDHSDDERIADPIYRASFMSDLAGQLFVRTIEVPESMRRLDAGPSIAFLHMPFADAIAYFLSKGILTPEEFYALSDEHRTRAFTASGMATDVLRTQAYDALRRALETGSTFDDFAQTMLDAGANADMPYLETVFRTNVMAGYGAGRYRQIMDPAVMAERPFVEYRTTQDSRVRPSHAALDGLIFRTDDETWRNLAPPSGFNCRCVCVTLAPDDLDGRRAIRGSQIPDGAGPDEGFDAPPTSLLDL